MQFDPAQIRDSRDVAEVAAELLGPAWFTGVRGRTAPEVVHVTAVWEAPGSDTLRVLPIHDETPRCIVDWFALNLARAAADAIIVTGATLRAEPELVYGFVHCESFGAALAEWRNEHVRTQTEPTVLVLTRGARVDFSHPLFHANHVDVRLVTGHAGAARARSQGVDAFAVDKPNIAAAVQVAQGRWPDVDFTANPFGAARVSIEAGPSANRMLYEIDPPTGISELWLSTYEAPEVAPSLQGAAVLRRSELPTLFADVGKPILFADACPAWTFARSVRRIGRVPSA